MLVEILQHRPYRDEFRDDADGRRQPSSVSAKPMMTGMPSLSMNIDPNTPPQHGELSEVKLITPRGREHRVVGDADERVDRACRQTGCQDRGEHRLRSAAPLRCSPAPARRCRPWRCSPPTSRSRRSDSRYAGSARTCNRRNRPGYFDRLFQYLTRPSLSGDPLSATPLATSSIASMPPATHHNSVSLSTTLALSRRSTSSWLFGGSLPAAS